MAQKDLEKLAVHFRLLFQGFLGNRLAPAPHLKGAAVVPRGGDVQFADADL
jgi:hypothetical protein